MDRDDRIENKIDKLGSDMTEVKVTLGKQHVVLVEHESRSTKLEAIVLPLHRKVTMLEGALKLIGGISVIMGIIKAVSMAVGN